MTDLSRRVQEAVGDNYVVERELGRGGMAVVYLATDRRHDRPVAVKVLHPQLAASIGPGRFLREIAIAARLTHPHVLPLFDSGQAGDLLFYVMPYVTGESLRERLDRDIQLPVPLALRIAADVASALDAAHHHGIVHRDIKPENILLEGDEAMVADFGVARAVHAAAGPTLSEPGLVVGTPAYMSPEQASAGHEVDGRTDVYSLGCVLYEMLAGEPPFTGPTAQAVLTRHMTEPPRSISALRGSVSPAVEQVVRTALAKVPADRYQSAGDMLRALVAVGGATGDVPVHLAATARRLPAWLTRLKRRWPIGLLALLAVVVAGLALSRPWAARPRLDSSLLMVAPFAHRAGAMSEALSGDLCESLLHRALIRWDGLRVVDPLWVADARARHGYDTVRLQHALELARERGAGRLATGEVFAHGDSLFVFAGLYDVGSGGELIREATAALAGDLHDASARFAELARSLVAGEPATVEVDPGPERTRSLAAWRAFHAGMLAFNQWDMAAARSRFDEAIAADPGYAQPRLWLAHTAWLSNDDATWTLHAREAARLESGLAPLDRVRARALHALGEERFPDACAGYATLVARDSLDFLAWFGLGECRQRDRLILTDAASPSGWRFRSSPHAAVRAYQRALEVVPSSHALFRGNALTRLSSLFVTDYTTFRLGYTAGGDTVRFGAWPGFAGDTLQFIPYSLDRLLAGAEGTVPATHGRAIAYNRELQRRIAATWAEAFPASADAREALARAHELLGQLDERAGPEQALKEVRAARALAQRPLQQTRLAVSHLRILLKSERFREARVLADSLAAGSRTADPQTAALVGPAAALAGRLADAARLARVAAPVSTEAIATDGTLFRAPPAVAAAAGAFLVYATLGGPPDSVRTLHSSAARLVETYFSRAEQDRATEAYLGRGEDFAYADRILRPSRQGSAAAYLRQLMWQMERGDSAGARTELDELQAERTGQAGEVSIDGVYLEARMRAALGDSGSAAAQLDAVLSALPALGTDLVSDVPSAASLVRAMALRARLAADAGDSAAAARWAGAVSELWAGSDDALHPLLREMNVLRSR